MPTTDDLAIPDDLSIPTFLQLTAAQRKAAWARWTGPAAAAPAGSLVARDARETAERRAQRAARRAVGKANRDYERAHAAAAKTIRRIEGRQKLKLGSLRWDGLRGRYVEEL